MLCNACRNYPNTMKYLRTVCMATALLCLFILTPAAAKPISERPEVAAFIDEMVHEHHFNRQTLYDVFRNVAVKQSILKAISRPAETKPWHAYRKIFVTGARVDGGVKFWRNNRQTLSAVQKHFGVPAEIIVAIIGVETRYGGNTGSYRVIDALSTLAFDYPKRSAFFRKEMEQFLLLCREEGIVPAAPKGSYAGAMGLPQFMPSSFRRYAADFEGDGKRDIWHNRADVIASVGNYFDKHGWRKGEAIAYRAAVNGSDYRKALTEGLEPHYTLAQMAKWGVSVSPRQPSATKAKLLRLDGEHGPEYWLALHNFYVITRYNHSQLYAMAVYQLSEAIRSRFDKTTR
jgi:peptidoglycan lytic transglycosylase B